MIQRVTMAEIARRANVHVSTVSMALRNHPEISQATRDKVKALAKEMGFRPDPTLGALIAYRRSVTSPPSLAPLAYLTHWHSRWGWQECSAQARFFAGASARAAQLGYGLEHFWLGEPHLTPRRMNDILRCRGIRGLVFASHLPRGDVELRFDWREFAAVQIDLMLQHPPLHAVTNNHRGMMQQVMRRIRAAGFERPGLVLPRWWDQAVDLAWSAGFLAEQQRFEPGATVPILWFGAPTLAPAEKGACDARVPAAPLAAWLERHEPDVLISHAPFVASSLDAIGSGIGETLPFVDLDLAQDDGQFAGLRHHGERVGEVAIESVAAQLQQNALGLPEFPTVTLVEGRWCEGASFPGHGQVRRRQNAEVVSAAAR